MVRYEIRKVFARTGSKIALVILAVLLGMVCHFAVSGVCYVNEQGQEENGYAAAQKLRQMQKEWAGVLDEEKLRAVIAENLRIEQSPEAQSKDITLNNIAFAQKQGIDTIRDLLNQSFAPRFREYDYYTADHLTPDDAPQFYANRTRLLREWLDSDDAPKFSAAKKSFLIEQFDAMNTPLRVDYLRGWDQLFEFAVTLVMIMVMVLGYLVAGIFSNEFAWKSDAVFFASAHGRGRAVAAKICAGVWIVTVVYWTLMLAYTAFTLLYLGADGAGCQIQVLSWKCFYRMTVFQLYLLIACGGYLGALSISLLTMLVSAKTRSSVVAVLVPVGMIFIPSIVLSQFAGRPGVGQLIGLLPDRLLQMNTTVRYFDLYAIGGHIIGAVPLLFVVYSVLSMLAVPLLYRIYRKSQIS